MPTLQEVQADIALGNTVLRGQIFQADDGTDYYVDTDGSFTILGGNVGSITGNVFYTSVTTMVADWAALTNGDVVSTSGYSVAGDGGGNTYIWRSTGRSGETMDEGFYVTGGDSDDYFEALDKTVIRAEQFGAVGDDSTDNVTVLSNMRTAFDNTSLPRGPEIRFGPGTFRTSATWDLTADRRVAVFGAGMHQTYIRGTITDGTPVIDLDSFYEVEGFTVDGGGVTVSSMADPIGNADAGYCIGLQVGTSGDSTSRGHSRAIRVIGCWKGVSEYGWLNRNEYFIDQCIIGFEGEQLNGGTYRLVLENCSQYMDFVSSTSTTFIGFQAETSADLSARSDSVASLLANVRGVTFSGFYVEEVFPRDHDLFSIAATSKGVEISGFYAEQGTTHEGYHVLNVATASSGSVTGFIQDDWDNESAVFVGNDSDWDLDISSEDDSTAINVITNDAHENVSRTRTNLLGDGRWPARAVQFPAFEATRCEVSWITSEFYGGREALRIRGVLLGLMGKRHM